MSRHFVAGLLLEFSPASVGQTFSHSSRWSEEQRNDQAPNDFFPTDPQKSLKYQSAIGYTNVRSNCRTSGLLDQIVGPRPLRAPSVRFEP